MNDPNEKRIISAINRNTSNTADRIALGHDELTLSLAAQILPFTGILKSDVTHVEFRVRKVGVPTDATYIANFTMAAGATPTTTTGQYVGNNDLYTVTNKTNVANFKIIATENLGHIMHIVYYGG